ncbi:hypothetical protein M2271_002066 [Streptomyces sp. LBL]|uniref:hypothetical protein n=1 Tax=Streptomyces sp. LBL TaxID=2940562 RepID=UPI0024767777|nr:hypothetical protein [Streptomyces sp. LBL]MDH6624264.1 hypothetical protein [Streptomyces sp. LBL]
METRPQCPRPPGEPRWVALFYRPDTTSWQVGAQSPDRSPVLYALGEMAQTLRARGEAATVALWGPKDEDWHRYDASASASASAPAPPEPAPPREAAEKPAAELAEKLVMDPATELAEKPVMEPAKEPTKLAERMHDRRHQALMAGLSKAGLYDLAPDDVAAVQAVVDRLDETTVRTLARWLATAAERPA